MNDPHESNHWDLLASELGATPAPPEPEKPEQPQEDEKTAEPASEGLDPSATESPPRSVPAPPRPPSDWARLAEELGLEPQEQPMEPPPSGAVSRAPDEPAETPAEAEPAADELVESTSTALMPTGAEVELPGFGRETAEPSEPLEADRTGRRRRQKPGRGRGRQPSEATTQPPEAVDQAAGATAEEAAVPVGFAEDAPEAVGSLTEEKPTPDRSKRRRRRGGGRKKGAGRDGDPAESPGLQQPGAEADESEGPQVAAAPAAERKSDEPSPKGGARKGAKSEKARKSAKTAHRGIPSWAEAVGIVISANLESRAKKPSSSSRSRGGRGRGGRDRSGERKK